MAKLIQVEPASWGTAPYWAAIEEAAAIIKQGGLVGFPTETVYGLAADALNPAAVARVFEVKQRPLDSPLILHLAEPAQAAAYAAELPATAASLMQRFWPGPLTLICRKNSIVPHITAGGRDDVGMRVPDHRVARDLIAAAGRAVVGPSANMSGRPSPLIAADVVAELGVTIDAVLDSGPSPLGMESTVLDLTVEPPRILRPGSVTLEDLQELLGPVAVVTAPPNQQPSASQAYGGRHRLAARLVLLAMPPGPAALAAAVELARLEQAQGRKAGILSADSLGAVPVGILHESLGEDLRIAAAGYYQALRNLESAGAQLIVACPLPRHGLGLAIMSRLEKAADEVISP